MAGLRTTLLALIGLSLAGLLQAEPGVMADKIVIGQSAGLTGPAAAQINDLTNGAKAYIDTVNKRGGVHGRRIVLESLDDGIDPKRTLANTEKLIRDGAFALFLYRGTPNVEAVVPLVEREQIPLIAPSSGAESMYQPPKRYLFPVRSPYDVEVRRMIDQMAQFGIERLAIVHENAAFGTDVLRRVQSATDKKKLTLTAAASYPRGTTDVTAAVDTIAPTKPQAVVLVGQANALTTFVQAMKARGQKPSYFTLSNVGSEAFIRALGSDARGVTVTQVTPYPYSVASLLSREFLDAVKGRSDVKPSYLAMEGYIGAKVLVEALRRAGPAPTREKLVAALESMNKYDLGGLEVSYGPGQRAGSSYADITMIDKHGQFIR